MAMAGVGRELMWCTAYGDVAAGEGLLHVDSYGQVAIAVRGGRADELYPLTVRTAVGIRGSGPTEVPITPVGVEES